MKHDPKFAAYTRPAGGWGSVQSLGRSLARERVPVSGARILWHQNKPEGFACVSCAWAKPAKPRPFEFCEDGAKATTWEITTRRCTPEFFAKHSVAELESWTDHAWKRRAGSRIRCVGMPQRTNTFRSSGRMRFARSALNFGRSIPKRRCSTARAGPRSKLPICTRLFARLYGTNNLPDSSNMCHESTSVGLPLSIGVPVGTITLDDFASTDCILFFGHNTGVNSPRMLHDLQECAQRGVPIIVFNPLRERGFERFTNPQSPVEMLSGKSTPISSQYHQIKVGGDKAALMGLCKAILALDAAAKEAGRERVLDCRVHRRTHPRLCGI